MKLLFWYQICTLKSSGCLKRFAVLLGARIASIVVGRPELFKEWNEEMEYMSGRIKVPRTASAAARAGCAVMAAYPWLDPVARQSS